MQNPLLRVSIVGETTAWGQRFVETLIGRGFIEADYVSDEIFAQRTAHRANPSLPVVAMCENLPQSSKTIQHLRRKGLPFYWIWFGRTFSKDELSFALSHRCYAVFETADPGIPFVVESLQDLGTRLSSNTNLSEIRASLKLILEQAEGRPELSGFLDDLKLTTEKLERTQRADELAGLPLISSVPDENLIPLEVNQLANALSSIENFERTGVLRVRGTLESQEGRIEFVQGRVVSATADQVHGLKAVFRMFLWDNPRLLFVRGNARDFQFDESIDIGTKYICYEGIEHRRTYEKVRMDVPSQELYLKFDAGHLKPNVSLTEEQFQTLASLVEFGKVRDILDLTPYPDATIYDSLIQLRKQNLIRVDQKV